MSNLKGILDILRPCSGVMHRISIGADKAGSSVDGLGTKLQARRLRVRLPLRSLNLFYFT
jgi:hypothetical protein